MLNYPLRTVTQLHWVILGRKRSLLLWGVPLDSSKGFAQSQVVKPEPLHLTDLLLRTPETDFEVTWVMEPDALSKTGKRSVFTELKTFVSDPPISLHPSLSMLSFPLFPCFSPLWSRTAKP